MQYYLRHFSKLLEFVRNRYHDILTDTQLAHLNQFDNLSEEAQMLFVRLSGRVPTVFRIKNINYPEIENPTSALKELESAGLVSIIDNIANKANIIRDIVTKKELKNFGWTTGVDPFVFIKNICEITPEVFQFILPLVSVEIKSFYQLLLFLYFANHHDGMEAFVLNEINNPPVPEVVISERRLFESRQQLDDYLYSRDRYHQLRDSSSETTPDSITGIFLETIQTLESIEFDLSDVLFRYRREYYLYKMLLLCIDILVTNKKWLHEWTVRTDSLEYPDIFSGSYIELRRRIYLQDRRKVDLMRFISTFKNDRILSSDEKTIINSLERSVFKRPLPVTVFPSIDIRLPKPSGRKITRLEYQICGIEMNVEQAVIHALKKENFRAFHTENRLIPALGIAAFYKEIYAGIPGVFQSPFQQFPLDFHRDSFFSSRRELFEKRLFDLKDGFDFLPVNDLVLGLQKDLLEKAWSLLGAEKALRLIFKWLENPGQKSKGMPDIFAFNDDFCFFMEVKSPSDKLQKHQIPWIEAIIDCGVCAFIGSVFHDQSMDAEASIVRAEQLRSV
ncbi:VRR-NUC domain-containing protein [Myxococcota bacterium]|nr:VRR-NUC domain-containing protein [Myxococcota bacterium]MBU1381202.1 VRR-NUC domain-containing protein [Myxococcota bacterium]MBU1495624.1 VRR-NUC domain-containing protein [Myxococcota bacterium]